VSAASSSTADVAPPARRALALVLRLGLGGLFIAAGAAKWRDPAGFAQEIANYQLLPVAMPQLGPHLATALPAMEIVAALAVLVGPRRWRQAGAAALAVLLVGLTFAVAAAAARGLDISCGCFGTGSGRVTWWTVARNLALLGASLALVVFSRDASVPLPQAAVPPQRV
jgi:putative oxidoreductase